MKRRTWQTGLILVATYLLVGRAIGELFLIDYHDPSSYRNDWGGPSLAGVLIVHCGPGIIALAGTTVWLVRRRRASSRRGSS